MVTQEVKVPVVDGKLDWAHVHCSWHFDGEDDPEFWKKAEAYVEKYKSLLKLKENSDK